VPDSLVPPMPIYCMIDPIADLAIYENVGEQLVKLTGISAGLKNENPVELSVACSDTNLISVPQILEFGTDTATLLYTPKPDKTGKATITITASAENSNDKSVIFDVNIMAQVSSVDIVIERDTLYQEIHGFGTYMFPDHPELIDLYAKDLGASGLRIGLISNQIEPANDNNDPNVLDLSAYNKSAFNFEYLREMHEKGVENIILTSWSPPAWMKRNLSVAYGYAGAPNYEDTDNILEPHYYDEFCESMEAAYRMLE